MQHPVPKTPRDKVRRVLFILLGIVLSTSLIAAFYVGWNYQRLTIKLANHFLQPYQIQVEHLSFTPLTLTHWQVPLVALTVNKSHINITGLDIVLDQDAHLWSLNIADLASLSAKKVKVQLDPSVLRYSSTPNNDPGPTMALDFTALPKISIGQTTFTVKGISAAKLNMTLAHMTLNKDGQFSSKISYNQHFVFSLDAQLLATEWRAKTQLNLTQLQALTADIHAAEMALFPPINNASSHFSPQQGGSLLVPLYQLQAAIEAQQIDLNATLDSTITLALKSGQLQSSHLLSQLQIRLGALAGLQLTPTRMVSHNNNSAITKKTNGTSLLKQPGQLAFNINGHITDLTLTVQPFDLPIILNQQPLSKTTRMPISPQIVSFLNNLEDTPLEDALAHLYQVLLPDLNTNQPKIQPNLHIKVGSPLVYQFKSQSLLLSKLSVALENTKLDTIIYLQNINYAPPSANVSTTQQNDFQLQLDWQLLASHQHSITINTLWPTLKKLPYNISINNAELVLQGDLLVNKQQGKSAYTVTVQPQSSLQTQGIKITSNHGNRYINTSPDQKLAVHIAETKLILASTAKYHFADGKTNISIPTLHYQVNSADLSQQSSDKQQTHYQLFVDAIEVELEKSISIQLDSNNTHSFMSQLMLNEQTSKLNLSLENIVLEKSALALESKKIAKIKKTRSSTKQTLLRLNQVTLSQQLNLHSNQLNTDETWLINGLDLFSQHHYRPLTNKLNQFQLEGDWQFNSDFEPIVAFLSQSDSLPESIDLNGNAVLNMHYQLNNDKYMSFTLALEPNVTDIQGNFANLPFEGGNIKTQCQYSWQQVKNSSSSFNCDDIKLSLQAFNPGVLMTNIEVEAALSFSTDANQSSTESNLRSHYNLTLPAELFGIQQASVSLTAKGDLLNGQLLIPQFQLNLKQPSSAYFVLQHIDIEQLLAIQPKVGVYADGIFDAVLPVTLENGKVIITGGQIAARAPGGLIAVSGNPAINQMRLSQPYLEFAFSALEHLEYSELSSRFDMDYLGNAILKVNVKGTSHGVVRPIHLNYSQEENLLQLLKSLQIGHNLQNQIENAVQ